MMVAERQASVLRLSNTCAEVSLNEISLQYEGGSKCFSTAVRRFLSNHYQHVYLASPHVMGLRDLMNIVSPRAASEALYFFGFV